MGPSTWLLLLLTALNAAYAMLPLEDATATVNQLFTYRIDPNDFDGQEIQVKEAGKDGLPSWIMFDNASSQLHGVPTAKEKGTYILSVGQELFAVTVAEPAKYQLAQPFNVHEPTVCKAHDSITVVYVKLNADVDPMMPVEKVRLVRSLTSHLSLKPDHVSMSAQPSDLVDSSHALVSGAGDVSSSGDSLSVLSWIVGCGPVKTYHMDILEKLESTAKDGSMGKALNMGVNGWQVQSNQPKVLSKRRLKRQALVTATAVPSPTMGDSTTMSSGPSPTAVVTSPTPTPQEPGNRVPELNETLLPTSIQAHGGELVRWQIPDRLFTDPDGEKLTYSVESTRGAPEWVVTNEVDGGKWELIGVASLNLADQVENLKLHARDPNGAVANATIEIMHGQNNKGFITQYSELGIQEDLAADPTTIVYLALTLQRIAHFDSILVEVKTSPNGNYVVLGDNMGYQESCPQEKNTQTLDALEDVNGQNLGLVGNNEESVHISYFKIGDSIRPCYGGVPMVSKKIAQYKPLTVTLGELYEAIVPVDMFTDKEDGDLSELTMKLRVDSSDESTSWISYDPASRRLQVFAWMEPQSEPQLSFVVEDSAGNEVEEPIKVLFEDNTVSMPSTNLITLTIDTEYSIFANSYKSQVDLYRKISNAFPNSVVNFKSVKHGSVIAAFSLRESSPSVPCNPELLESHKGVLFDGDNIRQSFITQLDSYPLIKVDFVPEGSCESAVEPKSANAPRADPVVTEEPINKANSTVIIVIIIVIILLVIIIIIVVVCVRKQKASKRENARSNGSDIEKRVPVVLEEEMECLNEPLMPEVDNNYKPTPTPPEYPGDDPYQPDTPPVSEPDDERRMIDRSP